jgi:uncharacterized membrane protein
VRLISEKLRFDVYARVTRKLDFCRNRPWLIPTLMTAGAALVAFVLAEIWQVRGAEGSPLPWGYRGNGNGAHQVLSTIASATATIAVTIYTITIVALALASTQFAPRLLRRYMGDLGGQFVQGYFIGLFTYCLYLVYWLNRRGGNVVPPIAAEFGAILGFLSPFMLIVFIDRICHSIIASQIIHDIAQETKHEIRYLYREWRAPTTREVSRALPAGRDGLEYARLYHEEFGYLQYINYQNLALLAKKYEIIFNIDNVVGEFIPTAHPIVLYRRAERAREEVAPGTLERKIRGAFTVGMYRTIRQDVPFGVRQIVDIALKAISPAVNDPTTALNCIDHLGEILATLAVCDFPEYVDMDQHTNLRVLARAVDFRGVCNLIFEQLLHFGADDPTIVLGLLRIIEVTLHRTENPAYLVVLYHQVLKIEIASGKIHDYYERRQVENRVDAASRLAVDKINSAKVAQSDYLIKLLNIIIECSNITNNTYYIAGFNRQVERIDSAAHKLPDPEMADEVRSLAAIARGALDQRVKSLHAQAQSKPPAA